VSAGPLRPGGPGRVRGALRSLGAAALPALLLTTLGCWLGSCGWHVGALAPEGARTVGVEVFTTNERVLERDVAPALHRELARAASDLSGLRLARADEADLVVRGNVEDYRRRSGIRSPDNDLVETGLRITVTAELYDRRTKRVVRRAPARLWSGYALTGPGDETAARERSLRHLAETLTLGLFRPQVAEAVPAAAAEAAPDEGRAGH